MIPSVDTHLYHQINEKLTEIQENPYIMNEILQGIQEDVRRRFVRAYSGENRFEVPIIYTLPQEKMEQRGSIYIGLKQGAETQTSLGNLEGSYQYKEDGLVKEDSYLSRSEDGNKWELHLDNPIRDFQNIENISFSRHDEVDFEDIKDSNGEPVKGKITFNYDDGLEGIIEPFTVNYFPKVFHRDSNYKLQEVDESGLQKGFTAQESYAIAVLSINMDTVRCLEIILKAIFIMMRDSGKEKKALQLQSLKFGQIEPINTSKSSSDGVPFLLYGKEVEATYTVSYNLDSKSTFEIKKVDVGLV